MFIATCHSPKGILRRGKIYALSLELLGDFILQVFDLLLLDADWSENAGMWLWLSGSSFFQQLPNCHCPVDFGKQIDPAGDFIK